MAPTPGFNMVVLRDDRAYVRLVDAHGEALFHTEVYESKERAARAVDDIIRVVYGVVETRHATGAPAFTVEVSR